MPESSEPPSETQRLEAAVNSLAAFDLPTPRAALILGSGLRDFGQKLKNAKEIPFDQVSHWPVPKVEGHGGMLLVGELCGIDVACLTGRVHVYEGWTAPEVVRALRSLRLLGTEVFLLTNAAGGVREDLSAGDLMLIQDQLNLSGHSPLLGEHETLLGPRFPDQSHVYDQKLQDLLLGLDRRLKRGVYAGLPGPSYETPAEVRMLRALGADAVGMSTVLEATALHAMGARVAGVSLISNLAAGIADTTLSHDEVIAAGQAAAPRLAALLMGFCQALQS